MLTWSYLALSREGRGVLLLALIAGVAGMNVEDTENHVLWAVLVSLLVASIAVRRWFAMPDVRVEVRAPARVPVGEAATVEVLLSNGGGDCGPLVVERPFLPWDGEWIGGRPRLPSLSAGAHAAVAVRTRFVARGWHELDSFFVAQLVPFGLAMGPALRSAPVRMLVVPRIAPVRSVRVPVTARFQPGGVALASKTGESMELYGLRPYRRGDRLRDLHAKTWARIGEPVVRDYRQEYFARIGVVVDTDLSVSDEDTLEAALSLTAGIVAHLSRGEALIDLLVTGRTLHTLTLGRSLGTFEQALDHLGAVKPGPVFDAPFVSRLLAPYARRLSSLVFVGLAWGDRKRLVDQIGHTGVSVLPIVVRPDDAAIDGVRVVSAATVRSGQGLAL